MKNELKFKVRATNLVAWLYSDGGSSEAREFKGSAIEELLTKGEFKLDIHTLFNECEYIPVSIIENGEELAQDEYFREGCILIDDINPEKSKDSEVMSKDEMIKELLERLSETQKTIEEVLTYSDEKLGEEAKEDFEYLELASELAPNEMSMMKIEKQLEKGKARKTNEELYEELMIMAHNIEDRTGYKEPFGLIVNQLQEFDINNPEKLLKKEESVEDVRQVLKDKGYFVEALWSTDDVIGKAKEMKIELNFEEAKEVLEMIGDKFDAEYGITWYVIEDRIKEYIDEK